MKDSYDVIVISKLPNFDLNASTAVVGSVFEHRKTALAKKLSYDQQAIDVLSRSWKRFIGTLEDEFSVNMPKEFMEVVARIEELLEG